MTGQDAAGMAGGAGTLLILGGILVVGDHNKPHNAALDNIAQLQHDRAVILSLDKKTGKLSSGEAHTTHNFIGKVAVTPLDKEIALAKQTVPDKYSTAESMGIMFGAPILAGVAIGLASRKASQLIYNRKMRRYNARSSIAA